MKGPVTLFTDYGCPFAQRLEALLRLCQMDFEVRLVDPIAKSPELLALTPSGRLPYVTLGASGLHETSVVADYLADAFGWQAAYPADPLLRARHRIAIHRLEATWDCCVDMLLQKPTSAIQSRRIDEDLDELERVVSEDAGASPNMLQLAAVPFWIRWCWMEDISDLAARIRNRSELSGWLDRGSQLEVIMATTPNAERVRKVHALG